jgi:hypothetical protein
MEINALVGSSQGMGWGRVEEAFLYLPAWESTGMLVEVLNDVRFQISLQTTEFPHSH